jgi:hypothetical protein
MRNALKEKFGEEVVAVGGAFVIEEGTAKLHVMPDFDPPPVDDDVDAWLKYFEMKAPLVCLSVFVSHDPVSNLT